MFESPRYVRGSPGWGRGSAGRQTSSSKHLVAAVRAAVLDPQSENAVVGMPPEMLEETGRGAEGASVLPWFSPRSKSLPATEKAPDF